MATFPARIARESDRSALTPLYAVWELTLACDLRCTHCGSRAGRARPRELTTAECLDVIASLARLGTREVTLIGGEAYLRRDWLEIVRAIADAGIACTMQTGGRNFTPERARAARAAGMQRIGVSIDGLADTHDRVRGVAGSFDAALRALRDVRDAGLEPGVNTQLSPDVIAQLPALMDRLIEAGASSWRIGLITPMGRAADNISLLLQPYQLLEVLPVVARLALDGRARGLEVRADNSLGYFGPYENLLRGGEHPQVHWSGCTAGQLVIGIESDGTLKGCPSLPSTPYGGGKVTELSLHELWRASPEIGFTRLRTVDALRGFCGSCYYADVCRAGCSWMGHTLLGQPGENPFCHHRAMELDRQGLRERIVRTVPAPGRPYDVGQFACIVERRDGSAASTDGPPLDTTRARDEQALTHRHWTREALKPCPACRRHVFPGTRTCPHCGRDIAALLEAAEQARARLQSARRRLEASLQAFANAGLDPARSR